MTETMAAKIDLQKADPSYYRIGLEPELRDLDGYYYLSLTGLGDPKSPEFEEAVGRLYTVAYGIKFLCKSQDLDFTVPKLEGYWWIDGGLQAQHKFAETPAEQWRWKLVIRMPDFVEGDHFYRTLAMVKQKRGGGFEDVKFELINERKCVQVLHVGSYDEEGPSIQKIMNFVKKEGLEINNYHHEIYLSDPRRTPEDRLKTILRYGVN